MGTPSSHESIEGNKDSLKDFLQHYQAVPDPLPHLTDATIYKKIDHWIGSNVILNKRYIFNSKEETPRFVELMNIRKKIKNVRYLPKLIEYYLMVEQGYCQTFYTYNVAYEFAEYNLERELTTRGRNATSSKVMQLI